MQVRIKFVGIVLAPLFLQACQPQLHSDLPQGAAAYEAVELSQADSVNSLTLLQPGDQLNVSVFEEPDLTTEGIVVDQAGKISVPLVGEIEAANRSPAQLSAALEAAYRTRFLRDPHVNVVLFKSAPRVLSVEGEVKQPGVFEVLRGYTLLTALALAGSPIETAKLDEVLIFREKGGQRYGGRFDITDIRAGRSPDPMVLPGDVIVVGHSTLRGAYLDFLKTAPLVGAFARY